MNIGKAFGNILGGVAKTALGGLGGMVVDKVAGQLFGSKNKPSNVVKDAFTPPANPYNVELVENARNLGTQGRDLTALVTPGLQSAISKRMAALSDTSDIDRLTQMARGQGITGNEAAFQRAKANTEASLQRRGVGGGVAAGARALLEGKKLAGQGMALQDAEKFRIGAVQQRNAELTNWLSQLLNEGQADSLRSGSLLYDLGNMEAQRKGQGQAQLAGAAQQIAGLFGQAQGTKTPTAAPVGKKSPTTARNLFGPDYVFEPAMTPLDTPLFTTRPKRRPVSTSDLADAPSSIWD